MTQPKRSKCELIMYKHSKYEVNTHLLCVIVDLLKFKLAKDGWDFFYSLVFENFIDCKKVYYINEYVRKFPVIYYNNVKKIVLSPYITEFLIGPRKHIGPLNYCGRLEIVDLSKSSITKIPTGIFKECRCLRKVIFGKNITKIGDNFAISTDNLKEITIPPKVRILEAYFCFWGGLEKIKLPLGLKKMEKFCLYNTKLIELTIPITVTIFEIKNIDHITSYFDRVFTINVPEHLREIIESLRYDRKYTIVNYY